MGIQKRKTMLFHDDVNDTCTVSSTSSGISRRNLAEDFELQIEPELSATPIAKQHYQSDDSPIGVIELVVRDSEDNLTPPDFHLHPALKRELSQALVNRVSLYSIIHDINKEASAMAANDHLSLSQSKSLDEDDEIYSPLIAAVNGRKSSPPQTLSMVESALIDEERWLLTSIEIRDEKRIISDCPPTFLQAMGEREYERLDSSRTQLWKPSRSWWEAKSGKNPWIEPKSHNKRWRYLWPLIHYHKFLAKCIKKLKRNGIDVKVSVSPVGVFLREEVCAISDHLASVSLFSSEIWMECLEHFDGWADFHEETLLRKIIRSLKLRPLDEPGDVDSPLLRSQIDEQFLRAMILAREDRDSSPQSEDLSSSSICERSNKIKSDTKPSMTSSGLPLHPKKNAKMNSLRVSKQQFKSVNTSHKATTNKSQSSFGDGTRSSHAASCGYPNGRYWENGWTPNFAVCDESNSVHSALSGETQACGYPPAHYDPYIFGFYPVPYYPPHFHEQYVPHYYPGGYATGYNMCINQELSAISDSSAPNEQYQENHDEIAEPPRTPSKPSCGVPGQYAPSPHYLETCTNYGSTYWGHMEYQMRQTLAQAGIITPHKGAPASPSDRKAYCEIENITPHCEHDKNNQCVEIDAKPLLLNHTGNYQPYNHAYGHESVPPSPATQFMMSPQADARSAAYYANYSLGGHYGFSPRRSSIRRKSKRLSPSLKESEKSVSPMKHDYSNESKLSPESDSEMTSATVPESESVSAS